MTKRLAGVIGGVLFAVAVATCTDIPSGPNAPFALELRLPASPSVILGDTLRDSLGALARLSAAAFNVKGDSIGGAAISFHVVPVLDSLKDDSTPARIDPTGPWLIADSQPVYATRTFRIYAQVGGLQSQTVRLTVTRRPDSLLYAGNSVDTTVLRFSDSLKTSPELAFRLRHDSLASGEVQGDSTVPAYLMRFQIVVPDSKKTDTAYVARVMDTSYVALVNGGRQSTLDTTDASGVASRAVRIRFAKLPFTKTAVNDTIADSIWVAAHAYRPNGVLVLGSGQSILLIVKARALTAATP